MEHERTDEPTPQIGDHVALLGTNIAGDVQRIDSSLGRDHVSFKVTDVLGAAKNSKAARAFHGAWITCLPELLVPRTAATPGSTMTPPRKTAPILDAALRAHVDRLVLEFAQRYSREQVEQSVAVSASHYSDARITAFVPLFIYRDARSDLSGN